MKKLIIKLFLLLTLSCQTTVSENEKPNFIILDPSNGGTIVEQFDNRASKNKDINSSLFLKSTFIKIKMINTPSAIAPREGRVRIIGENNNNVIEIYHHDGFVSRIGYFSQIYIEDGELVKMGQPIGIIKADPNDKATYLYYSLFNRLRVFTFLNPENYYLR